MKALSLRKIALPLSVVNAVAVIVAIALYLPDTVATHFNFRGVADAWGSKWNYIMFAFLPIFLCITYELYRKKSRNARGNQALEDKLIPLISMLFIAIGWLMIPLSDPEKMNLQAGSSLFIVFGVLMIVFSNYMGKIQYNRHLGLRVPWTLKNEVVWKKAHRLSGFTGIFGGLVLTISGVIGLYLPEYAFALGMAGLFTAILFLVIIPTVYSFVLYRKITDKEV